MRKARPTASQKAAAMNLYATDDDRAWKNKFAKLEAQQEAAAALRSMEDDLPWTHPTKLHHVPANPAVDAVDPAKWPAVDTAVETDDDAPLADRHQLPADVAMLRTFITAGRAVFTLQNPATGKRYTYRLREPQDKRGATPPLFVGVMTGPDNCASYTYAGAIWDRDLLQVKTSAKAKVAVDAPSMLALRWFLRAVANADAPQLAKVQVWHEGRCARCGRRLTVPHSIETGFGPECAGKVGL